MQLGVRSCTYRNLRVIMNRERRWIQLWICLETRVKDRHILIIFNMKKKNLCHMGNRTHDFGTTYIAQRSSTTTTSWWWHPQCHTHIHTYTHTHIIYTHTHTHTHIYIHTYIYTYIYTYTYTHTHTYTYTCTYTCTYTYTCTDYTSLVLWYYV